MSDCIFCDSNKIEETIIHKFKHWKLLLHHNQSYLGRTILLLKKHRTDLSELTKSEVTELFQILKKLRNIYEITFKASKINYSVLGNEQEHLHLHILPRYAFSVTFDNQKFEDQKFGFNPYPYDKNFKIPQKTAGKIKRELHSKLTS